jgi:hypothetical protein
MTLSIESGANAEHDNISREATKAEFDSSAFSQMHLKLVDDLRELFREHKIGKEIKLPQIIVCGSQSCGKSSVLFPGLASHEAEVSAQPSPSRCVFDKDRQRCEAPDTRDRIQEGPRMPGRLWQSCRGGQKGVARPPQMQG